MMNTNQPQVNLVRYPFEFGDKDIDRRIPGALKNRFGKKPKENEGLIHYPGIKWRHPKGEPTVDVL